MNNSEFVKAYMNLSRLNKYHIKVRNKIVTDCKVSTPVFYNWVKGITPVPHWAKPIICNVMQIDNSVLFPENETIDV